MGTSIYSGLNPISSGSSSSGGGSIDDTSTTSTDKTWSSNKINSELDNVKTIANNFTTSEINKLTIPSIDGLATKTYVDSNLSSKVDKDGTKVLSSNDYTDTEKNQVAYLWQHKDDSVSYTVATTTDIDSLF